MLGGPDSDARRVHLAGVTRNLDAAWVTQQARDPSFAKGDVVKWINRGDRPHTTTGAGWDVTLSPGEVFKKRFKKSGTFKYVCTFHSGMTGKVIVG